MTYLLPDYNFSKAFLWGNFLEHCEKVTEESPDWSYPVYHFTMAAIQFLPVISQLASIIEMLVAECFQSLAESYQPRSDVRNSARHKPEERSGRAVARAGQDASGDRSGQSFEVLRGRAKKLRNRAEGVSDRAKGLRHCAKRSEDLVVEVTNDTKEIRNRIESLDLAPLTPTSSSSSSQEQEPPAFGLTVEPIEVKDEDYNNPNDPLEIFKGLQPDAEIPPLKDLNYDRIQGGCPNWMKLPLIQLFEGNPDFIGQNAFLLTGIKLFMDRISLLNQEVGFARRLWSHYQDAEEEGFSRDCFHAITSVEIIESWSISLLSVALLTKEEFAALTFEQFKTFHPCQQILISHLLKWLDPVESVALDNDDFSQCTLGLFRNLQKEDLKKVIDDYDGAVLLFTLDQILDFGIEKLTEDQFIAFISDPQNVQELIKKGCSHFFNKIKDMQFFESFVDKVVSQIFVEDLDLLGFIKSFNDEHLRIILNKVFKSFQKNQSLDQLIEEFTNEQLACFIEDSKRLKGLSSEALNKLIARLQPEQIVALKNLTVRKFQEIDFSETGPVDKEKFEVFAKNDMIKRLSSNQVVYCLQRQLFNEETLNQITAPQVSCIDFQDLLQKCEKESIIAIFQGDNECLAGSINKGLDLLIPLLPLGSIEFLGGYPQKLPISAFDQERFEHLDPKRIEGLSREQIIEALKKGLFTEKTAQYPFRSRSDFFDLNLSDAIPKVEEKRNIFIAGLNLIFAANPKGIQFVKKGFNEIIPFINPSALAHLSEKQVETLDIEKFDQAHFEGLAGKSSRLKRYGIEELENGFVISKLTESQILAAFNKGLFTKTTAQYLTQEQCKKVNWDGIPVPTREEQKEEFLAILNLPNITKFSERLRQ